MEAITCLGSGLIGRRRHIGRPPLRTDRRDIVPGVLGRLVACSNGAQVLASEKAAREATKERVFHRRVIHLEADLWAAGGWRSRPHSTPPHAVLCELIGEPID